MNVKLIIDQAIVEKGQDINMTYGKRWINDAMDMLSTQYNSACVKKAFSQVVEETKTYALPSKCRGIYKVEILLSEKYHNITGNRSYYSNNFDSITYYKSGEYKVYIYRTPKQIENTTEEPEINSIYHMPISKFIASKEITRINKNSSRAAELMSEFVARAAEADQRLKRTSRSRPHIKQTRYWG